MEITVIFTSAAVCVVLVSIFAKWVYSFIDWLWLNPRRLDICLRRQGLKGSSYRVLFGDVKDERKMYHEAKSSPINLSDDIIPRVLTFVTQHIKKYGNHSL